MIVDPSFAAIPRVRHGFLTREGGISQGVYASLNCGVGSKDDPKAVRENRRRAMSRLGAFSGALATVHQAHTSDVLTVEAPEFGDERPIADAMVTTHLGVVLGILTADCAPVLFATRRGTMIAAAHAGWKGAIGGILENTLQRMVDLGARRMDIMAVIGPCIAQASYEVGPDFPAPFLAEDPTQAKLFAPGSNGHWFFDLGGYVAGKLRQGGVESIARVAADTYRDETRFFSYRRATLRREDDYGRHLSVVMLDG